MPERIQRRRTKGWRMPAGAVYVGRPTKWGSFWRPGLSLDCRSFFVGGWSWKTPEWVSLIPGAEDVLRAQRSESYATRKEAIRACAATYRVSLLAFQRIAPLVIAALVAPLRGHDLACWCPLVGPDGGRCPCHADVLLEIANA